MLDILKFLFTYIIEFVKILFNVDIGFTSLGVVFCIVYILLPIMIMIISFAKQEAITLVAKEYYDDEKKKGRKRK